MNCWKPSFLRTWSFLFSFASLYTQKGRLLFCKLIYTKALPLASTSMELSTSVLPFGGLCEKANGNLLLIPISSVVSSVSLTRSLHCSLLLPENSPWQRKIYRRSLFQKNIWRTYTQITDCVRCFSSVFKFFYKATNKRWRECSQQEYVPASGPYCF